MEIEVRKKLIELYHENKLSHAYLIETNDVEECLSDLKEVIKNILCPKSYQDNCEECNICNLINQNYLPALKIVEATGSSIKKEQIIDLKNTFSSMPSYTKENIYVIKEAEKLTSASANTMLKFLEEPESHIIGFFITNNINNVLATIKSRCEILKMFYNVNSFAKIISSEEYKEKIEDVVSYLYNLESNNSILYNKDIVSKYSEREEVKDLFNVILYIYDELLKFKLGEVSKIDDFNGDFLKFLEIKEVLRRIKLITKVIEDINYNANIDLLLDRFVIELGGAYE